MPLQLKLFERRPEQMRDRDSPEYLFASSYLLTRFAVGLVALVLPWGLVVSDAEVLESPRIRGSMSAYYHSSARDVFVGALFVVGAFMLSYMAARMRTWDFWLSSTGGVAALGVAVFPTARETGLVEGARVGVEPSATSCADYAGPPYCSAVQEQLGESVSRAVHLGCAGLLVLLLAGLCVVFALRELGYGPAARALCGDGRHVRAVLRRLDGGGALAEHLLRGLPAPGGGRHPHARGVLWNALFALVIAGGGIYALTVNAYWGEVVAFTGFGVAWLYAGRDYAPVRAVRAATRRIAPHPS